MKKSGLFISVLVSLFLVTSCHAFVKNDEFGVVDLNKVIDNYTEAQKVTADLKVKESKLQEFVLEAQKKIKEAKTPVEKKNLEEKFGEEFNIKRNAYAKEQAEKWEQIENDIYKEIEELHSKKNFDMVFNKQSVIIGGVDITEELLKRLNDEAKKK